MIVRRHYEIKGESLQLTTDNIRHYSVISSTNEMGFIKKTLKFYYNIDDDPILEVKLVSTESDPAHENGAEYNLPLGAKLKSVYIMNDEGKTVHRFTPLPLDKILGTK